MNGRSFLRNFIKAASIFAICIKEAAPSCKRTPPPAQNATTGRLFFVAYSKALAIFSPFAFDKVPTIKYRSIRIAIKLISFALHLPTMTDSVSPVRFLSRSNFSL